MKNILAIAALLSISSLSFAWEARGPEVAFETRPLGVSRVEAVEEYPASEMVAEEPVVAGTYPRYYRGEYRPVSGVIQGAETAAEGVVEGTAQAVRSIIP